MAATQENGSSTSTLVVNHHEIMERDREAERLNQKMQNVCLADDSNAPTVKQLKHQHREELACYLDPISHSVGWLQLGKHIFHGDKKLLEKVETLRLSYMGGGSPASAFMNYFRMNTECTVGEFITTAKGLQRGDITKVLQRECQDHSVQIDDLDDTLIDRITTLLDKGGRGIKNWRNFAYHFEYDDNTVDEFQVEVKSKNQDSPTQSLITLIKTSKPTYKLFELSNAASAVGRNDVKLYIDELIPSFN